LLIAVVALFNAIAKSKRDEQENTEETTKSKSKSATQGKAKDIIDMSRSNFLSLLKGDPPSVPNPKVDEEEGVASENDEDNGHEKSGIGSTSWSVLKDSYLTEKSLALKDWDQDDDESEGSRRDDDIEDPFGDLNENNKRKTRDQPQHAVERYKRVKTGTKGKGNKSQKAKAKSHKRK
jgi:hypothetical protein